MFYYNYLKGEFKPIFMFFCSWYKSQNHYYIQAIYQLNIIMSITKILWALSIIYCLLVSSNLSHSYTFSLLSHNDTIQSIQDIEENFDLTLPMVSFIWDEYGKHEQDTMKKLWSSFTKEKIYHITLSPEFYSSYQVNQWLFDKSYRALFQQIKDEWLKVVFRTMHEMNGGRYPWSWDPTSFKQARKRIYNISREVGLDQQHILFDFSVNGHDMPTLWWATPSQTTALITCTQKLANTIWCLTREDYYPWDAYVDVMWVSFYNRGKATSDRQRQSPRQIMEETQFTIRNRLLDQQKPIIIDEVGTTSVRYAWSYNRNQSIQYYELDLWITRKNQRLIQLANRAKSKPELVALNYFNVDRTMGLAWENEWEADRSVIDLDHDRYYSGMMSLYQWSDNSLSKLFTTTDISSNKQRLWWDDSLTPPTKTIDTEKTISKNWDQTISKQHIDKITTSTWENKWYTKITSTWD